MKPLASTATFAVDRRLPDLPPLVQEADRGDGAGHAQGRPGKADGGDEGA